MTTQHTPTPWAQHGLEVRGGAMIIARTTAKGWSEKDLPEREANAAFIVRACNAHEGLVDFLQRLEIVSGFTNTFKRQTEMAIVLRDLSGVLAKATGK